MVLFILINTKEFITPVLINTFYGTDHMTINTDCTFKKPLKLLGTDQLLHLLLHYGHSWVTKIREKSILVLVVSFVCPRVFRLSLSNRTKPGVDLRPVRIIP
ncbi:MAG: hypothetical protein ACI90V_005992 [Bacillariaceae sp.]|jgi:hypothetical protein